MNPRTKCCTLISVLIFGLATSFAIHAEQNTQTDLESVAGEIEEIETVDEVQVVVQRASMSMFWPFHGTLMGLATIIWFTMMLIARNKKKDKCWLAKHKALAFSSPLVCWIAIAIAYEMLVVVGKEHFTFIHGAAGIAGIVFSFIIPGLGLSMVHIQTGRKKVRIAHIWLGRIAVIYMFLSCISGFLASGIV